MQVFDTQDKIRLIGEEVQVLKLRIQEHGTGHIHTAISVLQHRIAELQEQSIKEQGLKNK